MRKKVITILLLLCVVPSANAAMVRIDFVGLIVADILDSSIMLDIPVHGHFVLDPTVPDIRPGPDSAHYSNSLVSGLVMVGDVTYEVVPSPLFGVYVHNDNDVFNDFFAVVTTFAGGFTFGLQFSDSTRSVYSDDSFPMSIDLQDFDEFTVNNFNGTGIFFASIDGSSGQGGFITSAEMRTVVPLPAAVWMLLPALALLGRRKKTV